MQSSTFGRLCTVLTIDLRRTYSCPKKRVHYNFHATIRLHEAFVDEDLFIACNQLATTASEYVKELIVNLGTQCLSKQELQLATSLATKSRQYFERVAFTPAQKVKAIIPVAGEPLHSPKTKYQLSKLGLAVMAKWKEHI